jgi:hypothetical protein
MTPVEFTTAFRAVYDRASARYAHGGASAANLLNEADIDFLASQGITAQHVFDYVEDLANYGAPDFATAHAIELVRRDYFLNVQKGRPSSVVLDPASLPAKTATLLGMTWLPRLIPKARAKLRGELPASMMFCCGGDREFFKKHAITAAEFLSIVGTHETDDSAVATEIVRRSGKT